jgi:hypothetical protein
VIRRYILAAALLAGLPALAAAQSRPLIGMTYSWSLPMADTKTFADNDSWIGFAFESKWYASDNAAWGIYLGWNEFYHRTEDVLETKNGAIFGTQYRDYNVFPLLLTGSLYTGEPDAARRMYLSVGAGAYYTHQTFDIGLSTVTEDIWQFGVSPEIGVQMNTFRGSTVQISARYHYALESESYLQKDPQTQQYLSVGIGFFSKVF